MNSHKKNKTEIPGKCLTILFFLFPLFFFILPSTGNADNKAVTSTAHHMIAISFDLEKSLLTGTSQITLPAGKELSIDCGHLEITGSILKQQGNTPLTPIADSNNIIHIAARTTEQTIFISWKMAAERPMATSNLIAKHGITLAGFWHPIPNIDMTYELHAALPDGFSGISEGEQVEIVTVNQTRTLKTNFPWPTRSINFAAGDYIIRSIQVGNASLYSYFFPEDDHLSEGYLKKGAEYIKRYEKLIGPFPYSRYSIVANRLPAGYGMRGFTLLGQAVIRMPFIKYTSLGHEILHSWFGNSIGLSKNSGNWCEGLTTYLADQSYAADLGKGAEYRKNQILRYHAFVHNDNTMPLAEFIGAGRNQTGAKKIRAIGYNKASMVFHMLNKKIGEENFIRGLREFYVRKKHQRASWQDIENIFSEVSGHDLSLFFYQWLNRVDIPKIEIKNITTTQENGQSLTSFSLTQTNRKNIPYLLQVPIEIKTISAQKQVSFTLDQAEQDFTILTDTLPRKIIIDPNYDLFRQLEDVEIPSLWAGFLGAGNKYIILPDNRQQAATYQPLANMLLRYGVKITTESQVSNRQLGEASFIFAGDSVLKRTIFAGIDTTETRNKKAGFTLNVRKNPLNYDHYMVLINGDSAKEVRAAARKLPHYGKYSFLSFSKGKLVEKRIDPSQNGIIIPLLEPPPGMPVNQITNFNDIINDIGKSRVIYVGETHTEYSHHLLQLQVIQALHAKNGTDGENKNKKLAIGMEMFPRSAQPVLDDYISGKIKTEKDFLKKSDYFSVWGYDYRLYRGIINFARKNRIPIIGLNLERNITRQVFRNGNTDGLSPEDWQNISQELDLDIPSYRERLRAVHAFHASSPGHQKPGFSGFLQAQALWDETMAETIANYLQKNPRKTMIVIAGSGHVYKDSGIPLRVERRIPEIRQSVLIGNNGFDTGQEIGRKVDYLIFIPPAQLPQAAKIGVVLKEEATEDQERPRLKITEVSPHGHGMAAGLEKGDIIVRVDGELVHKVADIRIALLDKTAKDTVNLEIFREQDGSQREKTILNLELELTYTRPARVMTGQVGGD
jgi:uncharacterized iron-regulated protein